MGYLTQSAIAADGAMAGRVAAAAAEQGVTTAGLDPDVWAYQWRRVWAAAPGWDAAWESWLASHPDNPPGVTPGTDEAVITDAMVLAQVQAMMPFAAVGAPGE